MSKILNQPPLYQKDAIATFRGWIHPKTGELLVSNKSLNLKEIEKNFPNQVKYPVKELTVEQLNDLVIKKEMKDEIVDAFVKISNTEFSEMEDDAVPKLSDEEFEHEMIKKEFAKKDEQSNDEIANDIVKDAVETIKKVEQAHEDAENSKLVFADMTKAQLIDYAHETYNVILNKKDNKDTLLEKINELDG